MKLIKMYKKILNDEAQVLEIPTWLKDELEAAKERRDSPAESTDEKHDLNRFDSERQEEYSHAKGYQFQWGHIREILADKDSSIGVELRQLRFNFFFDEITRKFPFPHEISSFMVSMYSVHKRQHPEFDYCYGDGAWDVFELVAHGDQEIRQLREWLVRVFLPEIFPDLSYAAEELFTSNCYLGENGETWRPVKV